MQKRYDLLDEWGNLVVENLPTYEAAFDYALLKNLRDWDIVVREVSTVRGYGRDPDLH